MLHATETAVEITKREDSLDIWVDANNNGVRDDDDVNIFVTAGGGFYTISPTFKQPLDTGIQAQIKEVATNLLNAGGTDAAAEQQLRDLSLELVVRATTEAVEAATIPVIDLGPAN